MSRWGMVIDLDKCTGCQACVIACKQENNVPFSSPEEHTKHRFMNWIHVIAELEGEYPDIKSRFIPILCQHCDNPPCVRVCPTSATYINDEGIVGQIYARCIGCRYCANACPYGVKNFNYFEPKWPDRMKPMLNEDVSIRNVGVVEKCTFCHHRLNKGRENARNEGRRLRPDDYVPACVQSCPAAAMVFGDLEDPESDVARLAQSSRMFRKLEDLGTEPKVFYLKET